MAFTVWAAYRNADLNEGRGPMALNKLFTSQDEAEAYINSQTGVMGRHPSQFGKSSWVGMGDWEIRPLVVED